MDKKVSLVVLKCTKKGSQIWLMNTVFLICYADSPQLTVAKHKWGYKSNTVPWFWDGCFECLSKIYRMLLCKELRIRWEPHMRKLTIRELNWIPKFARIFIVRTMTGIWIILSFLMFYIHSNIDHSQELTLAMSTISLCLLNMMKGLYFKNYPLSHNHFPLTL